MKLEINIEDYQTIRTALMERPAKEVYELTMAPVLYYDSLLSF